MSSAWIFKLKMWFLSNIFQVTDTEVIYMQNTFRPGLPASNFTPHKATCCCVIAACSHCGASSSFVPASLSRTLTAAKFKCPLLNNVKDSVSARGISSTIFSSSVMHTRDAVALKIKAPTKQHFYYYQFRSTPFGRMSLWLESVCQFKDTFWAQYQCL